MIIAAFLFAAAVAAPPPQTGGRSIAFSEPARPIRYQIELTVVCGPTRYDVAVENSGPSGSRLLDARANGRSVTFAAGNRDLESVIQGISVIRLTPIVCDATSGTLQVEVEGYDPVQDGLADHDGEVVLTFTSSTP